MKNTQNELIKDKWLILSQIKSHYNLKSDVELACFLEIKANTLGNWKKRNTFDYEIVYTKCDGINANWLLTGKGEMFIDEKSPVFNEPDSKYIKLKTPNNNQFTNKPREEDIVYLSTKSFAKQFDKYGNIKSVDDLPPFSLPTIGNNIYRVFEMNGNSMFPTLYDKEIIIGQGVMGVDEIKDDTIYILQTKDHGIIIKRLLNRINKYGYVIAKDDNTFKPHPTFNIDSSDLIEIWLAVWHGGANFKSPDDFWKRQIKLESDLIEIQLRLKAAGI